MSQARASDGAGAPGAPFAAGETAAAREALADCPIVVAIPVAWGDMDAFQHVNNAVYLRWFETARIAAFDATGLNAHMAATQVGPILAETRVRYRRPVSFPDVVRVGARFGAPRSHDFPMTYVVWSDAWQAVAADGDARVVTFDYGAQQKAPVPQAFLDALAALAR